MSQPTANLPFRTTECAEFPIEIQIQTHTACNARCIMCPYVEIHDKINHGQMSEQNFHRLIDECSKFDVRHLKPFLMNEPLIDKRLPKLIRYAKSKLPQAAIGFGTNGALLKNKMAQELLDSDPDEICFNFPSINKAIYESIMIRVPFEVTLKNITTFAKQVASAKKSTKLMINIVEIASVLDGIEASEKFWTDHGFIVLRTPLNNRGGNINDQGLRALPHFSTRRVCDRPFNKIYIRFNGDVILCSSDWQNNFILGNVFTTSIREVWQGEKQKKIRLSLLANDSNRPALCQQCDYTALFMDNKS